MKLAAFLGAIALIPVAAALGWVTKPKPGLPTFGQYVTRADNVKHVPGNDSDDWLAEAVTGPNKGGAMNVTTALSIYPTHKALEQSAHGKVVYVEMRCSNYTTTAKRKLSPADKVLIRRCTQTVRTRRQAEKYMMSLLAPKVKS